jgi:hypothetical protein
MSMQMGPDGVKVEVKTKNDKGEEETKTYEAPDMETFRAKYPGVLDGAGMGGAGCMNQKGFSKPITEGAEASQAAILPVSLPQPRCNQNLDAPIQS